MDWTPGTWWRAPRSKRRWAYYLCLRTCYGMRAIEAFAYMKKVESQNPTFIEGFLS